MSYRDYLKNQLNEAEAGKDNLKHQATLKKLAKQVIDSIKDEFHEEISSVEIPGSYYQYRPYDQPALDLTKKPPCKLNSKVDINNFSSKTTSEKKKKWKLIITTTKFNRSRGYPEKVLEKLLKKFLDPFKKLLDKNGYLYIKSEGFVAKAENLCYCVVVMTKNLYNQRNPDDIRESINESDITSEIKKLMELEKKHGNVFYWEYDNFEFSTINGKPVIISKAKPHKGDDAWDDFSDFDRVSWLDIMKSKEFKKFLEDNGYKPSSSYSTDDVEVKYRTNLILYI